MSGQPDGLGVPQLRPCGGDLGCSPHPPPVPGPSSRFRHAQGRVLHRDTHLTNLRGLSLTTPGECDGFCANHQRVALPLLSAGGQIAILEVTAGTAQRQA